MPAMKKRFSFCLLFFAIVFLSQSQEDIPLGTQQIIDEQVWEPFKVAYEARDAEAFLSIHTDDVLRITENGIRFSHQYKESITENYSNAEGPAPSIDFVFEHQLINGDTSYQVGYYKVSYQLNDGSTKDHFGRFHVVLKEKNGIWKIAQDWDTSTINGHQVSQEDFDRLKK